MRGADGMLGSRMLIIEGSEKERARTAGGVWIDFGVEGYESWPDALSAQCVCVRTVENHARRGEFKGPTPLRFM